jgi:hypothetical protein
MTNIVNIADSPSPLNLILRRRQAIKSRLAEIKDQRAAFATEETALHIEDRELAVAEGAVKKLLER